MHISSDVGPGSQRYACSQPMHMWTRLAIASLAVFVVGCNLALPMGSQQPQRHRIGFIAAGSASSTADSLKEFRAGLGDHGYVEGDNIELDVRYADGREERFNELAAEIVPRTDVIVTGSSPPVRAIRQLSASIPVVFATVNDPVEQGLVESLARPGGNTTGLTLLAGEESSKRLQLLREMFPEIRRVAVLWNQTTAAWLDETVQAGNILGVDIVPLKFTGPEDLDALL